MGHSDEWTFADYFKYEKEIYRAIISAAVLCRKAVYQILGLCALHNTNKWMFCIK